MKKRLVIFSIAAATSLILLAAGYKTAAIIIFILPAVCYSRTFLRKLCGLGY
jgi:hypothetical protein